MDVVHFHAIQLHGVERLEQCYERDILAVVTMHDAWWLCGRQFMILENGQPCGAISPESCSRGIPDPVWNRQCQEKSHALLE